MNFGSFSRGWCDNPHCGHDEPVAITTTAALNARYCHLQAELNTWRHNRTIAEDMCSRHLGEINAVKRELAELNGHRPGDAQGGPTPSNMLGGPCHG